MQNEFAYNGKIIIDFDDCPDILFKVLNSLDDGIVMYGRERQNPLINETAKYFLSRYRIINKHGDLMLEKTPGINNTSQIQENLNRIDKVFNGFPVADEILNIIQAYDPKGNRLSFYAHSLAGQRSSVRYGFILIKINENEKARFNTILNISHRDYNNVILKGIERSGGLITIKWKYKN